MNRFSVIQGQKDRIQQFVQKFMRTAGQMLYGATVYEMVRDLKKERAQLEHLFVLIVFGDFLGIPIIPPYYVLSILPYITPTISCWKRSMLRERDITDLCDQEIT